MSNIEDDAVARLLAAYENKHDLFSPEAGSEPDLATVYRIQQRVTNELASVGAFKAGRDNPESACIYAPILTSGIFKSGSSVPSSRNRLRGVELEIGFQMITDPPDADDPDFEEKLRSAVVLVPALEIIESRLEDPDKAGPLWKLADSQVNGGLVYGQPLPEWQTLDLASREVRLTIGDQIVHDGIRHAPGGNAFDTFAAFVKEIGDHCGGLQLGQTVITGSFTGVDYANAGDHVEGVIDGLGVVHVAFD